MIAYEAPWPQPRRPRSRSDGPLQINDRLYKELLQRLLSLPEISAANEAASGRMVDCMSAFIARCGRRQILASSSSEDSSIRRANHYARPAWPSVETLRQFYIGPQRRTLSDSSTPNKRWVKPPGFKSLSCGSSPFRRMPQITAKDSVVTDDTDDDSSPIRRMPLKAAQDPAVRHAYDDSDDGDDDVWIAQ